MKIQETTDRGEKLIEIGNETEARRGNIQLRLQSAQGRLAQARLMLESASETDEDGNTSGDVGYAQAEVSAAMMDVEYYESQLEATESELERIRAEKLEIVRALDEYCEGEQRNVDILGQLQGKAFGGNVAGMIAAIIGRMNLADNTRVAILNSLGLGGSSSAVSAGGGTNQILQTPSAVASVADRCIALLRGQIGSFSAERWSKLSPEQRGSALNALAMSAGQAMGIGIKGARFYTGSAVSRGYYNQDGYVYLNDDVLTDESNRLDALDTVFHEGRHAFQRAAMNDPEKYGISQETAEAWRNNQPPYNYIRHDEDPVGYRNQPIERDAFSFAASVIKGGLS